jgi:hypothetical protein
LTEIDGCDWLEFHDMSPGLGGTIDEVGAPPGANGAAGGTAALAWVIVRVRILGAGIGAAEGGAGSPRTAGIAWSDGDEGFVTPCGSVDVRGRACGAPPGSATAGNAATLSLIFTAGNPSVDNALGSAAPFGSGGSAAPFSAGKSETECP